MLALSLKNLTKTYPKGTQALKGVDLSVEEGAFFALLGANGAGKSTIIGIVTGLVNKSGGKVEIFGQDIDQNFAAAKRYLGVVPQEFNFDIFQKVLDIVVQQAGYFGIEREKALSRAEFLLKKLELWEKRDQKAQTLSGGMKRRLMIARALMHEPKLLILDEPTAGVDAELRRGMWDFLTELNKSGTTIILTTHYLEEAETLCKQVAIIKQGQIIRNDTVRNVLASLETEKYLVEVQNNQNWQEISGFLVQKIDSETLELTLRRGQTLNQFIQGLTGQNIVVTGMRPKENRLEEFFLETVNS